VGSHLRRAPGCVRPSWRSAGPPPVLNELKPDAAGAASSIPGDAGRPRGAHRDGDGHGLAVVEHERRKASPGARQPSAGIAPGHVVIACGTAFGATLYFLDRIVD
jgi:hypothetical protein